MTQTIRTDQIIAEKVRTLSPEKQQQVLEFVEFLLFRSLKQDVSKISKETPSFLEATKEFAGCLDGGPSDLSTNKNYLERLGTE